MLSSALAILAALGLETTSARGGEHAVETSQSSDRLMRGRETKAAARYQMKAAQTVRVYPATTAAEMGSVWDGELVEIQCQDRGTSVGGSTLWDYIQYEVDGTDGLVKRGWVPDYYVLTGTTDPLDGVKQGDCPAPLTEPGGRASAPAADDESSSSLPPACRPTPAVQDLRLTAGVRVAGSERRRRSVTTRHGKRVAIRARLRTLTGEPLADQWVCIVTRTKKSNAELRARKFALTDERGTVTYRTPPGPSQRIWFVHPTAAGQVSANVLVRVRAPVELRTSRRSLRNGQTLFLRGSIRDRGHAAGDLVELQARRGSHWQTFGTTRTERGGAFSFPYTFRRTEGVQRYHLRARVPAQRGLPYATGASSPVTVEVRG